jgi:hypothetical protein
MAIDDPLDEHFPDPDKAVEEYRRANPLWHWALWPWHDWDWDTAVEMLKTIETPEAYRRAHPLWFGLK